MEPSQAIPHPSQTSNPILLFVPLLVLPPSLLLLLPLPFLLLILCFSIPLRQEISSFYLIIIE
jgi:hypothetical protein